MEKAANKEILNDPNVDPEIKAQVVSAQATEAMYQVGQIDPDESPIEYLKANAERLTDQAERERVIADIETLAKAYPPETNKYLAPNGKPSNLNHAEWYAVRTPSFKEWFGDWEAIQHREYLDGKSILELKGTEFEPDGQKITEKVNKWIEDNGFKNIDTPIGNVLFDERAVKNDISHGKRREKIIAFAAVPEVLKNGRIIHTGLKNNLIGHLFAAPVKIGSDESIVCALVRADKNTKRLYVHEVATKEEILASALKTEALTAQKDALNGADAGILKKIIQHIYSVKPDSVSKITDENGEPLKVWHGGTFKKEDIPKGGMHFGTEKAAQQRMKGKRAKREKELNAEFLNVKNPVEVPDTYIKDWTKTIEWAKAKGHDGIIYKNNVEDKGSKSYIAFTATQIKSATDNAGTYNPQNPSTLFQTAYHGSPHRFGRFD